MFIQDTEKTASNGWIYYRGTSPLAVKLQEHIRLVAPVDTLTVLVRGASGTGKEYVAQHIHALSGRADAPFVWVDCGALPKELAASELFGHMKGAFTGAVEDKTGIFTDANRELGKDVKRFDRETQRMLKAYSWPGNIRKLKGVIKRVALLAKDGWIVTENLKLPYKCQRADGYALNDERTERENIVKALEATGGDKKAAARLLGISRSTLYLKMEKYRLK